MGPCPIKARRGGENAPLTILLLGCIIPLDFFQGGESVNGIRRFFGHLHTVNSHRFLVLCNCIRAGIPWRGLCHDLSKYAPSEFLVGVRYYQGNRSPNEKEREIKGYSEAWMHHKGRNRHHFEYWTDYDSVTKTMAPVPMPRLWVAEMFCDRVAASKIYMKKDYDDTKPLAYFLKGRDRRLCHPQTAETVQDLLERLAEEGEKKTFRYIRKVFLKGN